MGMEQVVHPATRQVPVAGGAFKVAVSPWTMAQRSAIKPRLVALLKKLGAVEADPKSFSVAELFDQYEDELAEIVKDSIHLPAGKTWEDLCWEDEAILVQAVWEVCVVREGTQGLAGKLAGALGKGLRALLNERLPQTSSPSESSAASPSSPAGGAPTPSGSATP